MGLEGVMGMSWWRLGITRKGKNGEGKEGKGERKASPGESRGGGLGGAGGPREVSKWSRRDPVRREIEP